MRHTLVRFIPPILLMLWGFPTLAQEALSRQLIDQIKKTTVFVEVGHGESKWSGSGFLFMKSDPFGYVVTNAHVVVRRGRVMRPRVVFDSGTGKHRSVSGTVVGVDSDQDLAVIKVQDRQLPEPLAIDQEVELYETLSVLIFGFPFGEALATAGDSPAITVSQGTVSSIRRDKFGKLVAVQIDGSVNPGNSGGPIVTAKGELIGVALAKIRGTQIAMAVPTHKLREMLSGRIESVYYTEQKRSEQEVTYRIAGKAVDPLSRIRKASLYVATRGQVGRDVPREEDGLWPQAAPDMQHIPLRIVLGRLSGEVTLKLDPKRHLVSYVLQPAYVNGEGKLIYMEPVEFAIRSGRVLTVRELGRRDEKPPDWLGAVPTVPNVPEGDGEPPPRSLPPTPRHSHRLLAGERTQVNQAMVTEIDRSQDKLVPHLVWSSDGRYLFTLSEDGMLRKIDMTELREVMVLPMAAECCYLGRSQEGLVLFQNKRHMVWLIDQNSLIRKHEIHVENGKLAACARASSMAFVATDLDLTERSKQGLGFPREFRWEIVLLDLKQGRIHSRLDQSTLEVRAQSNGGTHRFPGHIAISFIQLTPDGRYLFCCVASDLHRLRVSDGKLQLEESSNPLSSSRGRISVSPDSRYVCVPNGNLPGTGRTPRRGYWTDIYDVANLRRPRLSFNTGPYPRCLAFDPRVRKMYAQNYQDQLLVLNTDGELASKHRLSRGGDKVSAIFPHPTGNKVLVLTQDHLFFVELPEEEGGAHEPEAKR